MLDYFVPENNETNDSAVDKQTRELIKKPIDTEDKPFAREETASVIKKSLIPKSLLGRMD